MAGFKTHIGQVLVLVLSLASQACSADPAVTAKQESQSSAPPSQVESLALQSPFRVCGQDFVLEVARRSSERNQGLMYRRSLAGDRGMIFVFRGPAPQTFWMKNVPIGLDILFFNSKGRLLNSMTMHPESPLVKDLFLKRYSSAGEAQFVVELKEGTLARMAEKMQLQNCTLSPLPKITDEVDP